MTQQELINAISKYIKDIAARILALAPDAENDFLAKANAFFRDQKFKDDDFKNPHIKFFAALKLLDHVINNKPLDETQEPLLNAAIKENRSNLNKLYLQYNEFLKKPAAPSKNAIADDKDTKQENPRLSQDEKINPKLTKIVTDVIKHLIKYNKYTAHVSANFNRLAELFGVDFLVELQNIHFTKPAAKIVTVNIQQLGAVQVNFNVIARAEATLAIQPEIKRIENFFNQENYNLAVWGRIDNINTLLRLLPKMEPFYIHANLAKILKLVKTKNDFFAVYKELCTKLNDGIIWPLEFTERCFDPKGVNICLQNFLEKHEDPKYIRPNDADNLINSPRAALLAATHLINTIEDFEQLAGKHPNLVDILVQDKAAAIILFNKLFANDIDQLIRFMNFRLTDAAYNPKREVNMIFTLLNNTEILDAVLGRITPQQVTQIRNDIQRDEHHKFIIDILRARKLPAVAPATTDSKPIVMPNEEKLTLDDLKDDNSKRNLVAYYFNDKNIAERCFERWFANNMSAFIDIFLFSGPYKNLALLLRVMLNHPTIIAKAVKAIDPANIGKFFQSDYGLDCNLAFALVARPDKMLAFAQFAFPNAQKFTEYVQNIFTGNSPFEILRLKQILNHDVVIAHIAGLFTNMQQLLAFKAIPLANIHPVYYIAEWLIRNRIIILNLDAATTTTLNNFLEQFHGFTGMLKLDPSVGETTLLLAPLMDVVNSSLYGDKESHPIATIAEFSPTVTHSTSHAAQAADCPAAAAPKPDPMTAAGPLPGASAGVAAIARAAAAAGAGLDAAEAKPNDSKTSTPTAKP